MMHYWEMFERDLRQAGYHTTWTKPDLPDRDCYLVDAQKDGQIHRAEAETLLTAFIEVKNSVDKVERGIPGGDD